MMPVQRIPLGIGQAHNEAGQIEATTDFDYDELDARLFNVRPETDLEQFSAEEMERGLKVFRVLTEWMWQDGMKNSDGLTIRSIIVCWIFLKHLHPLTLTEIARGFGKKKQSLGRWVDDFKRAFPHIRNPHMK